MHHNFGHWGVLDLICTFRLWPEPDYRCRAPPLVGWLILAVLWEGEAVRRACNPLTPVVTLTYSGEYTLLGGKGLRTVLATEKGIGVTQGEETESGCNLVTSFFLPSLTDSPWFLTDFCSFYNLRKICATWALAYPNVGRTVIRTRRTRNSIQLLGLLNDCCSRRRKGAFLSSCVLEV